MQTLNEIQVIMSMYPISGGCGSAGVFCGPGFDSASQTATGSGSGV